MMKHFLLAIVCLLSLKAKAQVYSFYNEKTYYGNVRMGDDSINLNDNDEWFLFGYLPKVGNTCYSQLHFYFASSDVDSFLKYEKKEVHDFKLNLVGGNTISLSSSYSKNNDPLVLTVADGVIGISTMFVEAKLNGESFSITSKTKDKDKIKWIKQIKYVLMSNDITSIEIEAVVKDSNENKDVKIHYDITKPTTYIFKSLMYDEEK